jgi:hypothetical protein
MWVPENITEMNVLPRLLRQGQEEAAADAMVVGHIAQTVASILLLSSII